MTPTEERNVRLRETFGSAEKKKMMENIKKSTVIQF